MPSGDADAFADNLDGSEGPAGVAGALVADFLEGIVVGPCLCGEELIGMSWRGLDVLDDEFDGRASRGCP
jgi:hypothetical protein